MVKRRRTTKAKVVKMGGKAYVCKPTKALRTKYKKCIITAIRGTKITTRKGAQKAFRAAAKKCGAIFAGVKPRKTTRRKTTRGRRRNVSPRLSVPNAPFRMGGTAAQRRRMAMAGVRGF